MKSGIYKLVICERIDKNGIAINPIEYNDLDASELKYIKEAVSESNWKVYSQNEIKEYSEIKVWEL